MQILIADHHPIFRRGLKSMMRGEPRLRFKGKVDSGEHLIAAIDTYEPDLIILELDLPKAHGVAILRKIQAHAPHVKILVLSCHPEEIYALSAIKAGAHGYICKNKSAALVKKAIFKVCNGDTYLSQNILENIKNDCKNSHVLQYKKLSIREIEVLNLLSRGKRNKEISHDLGINEKTVSTYKTRLLKKLKIDSVAELINQARLLLLTE